MSDLPYERLIVAVQAVATMEGALEETVRYVKGRKAFGKSLLELQNTRFRLAEAATVTRVARTFIDRCIQDQLDGSLDDVAASMAKYWSTDMLQKVVDECVQLHGGYGYMNEYLVARMYADARVMRIYGGTNEIMKELIAALLPEAHSAERCATQQLTQAHQGRQHRPAPCQRPSPWGCSRYPTQKVARPMTKEASPWPGSVPADPVARRAPVPSRRRPRAPAAPAYSGYSAD